MAVGTIDSDFHGHEAEEQAEKSRGNALIKIHVGDAEEYRRHNDGESITPWTQTLEDHAAKQRFFHKRPDDTDVGEKKNIARFVAAQVNIRRTQLEAGRLAETFKPDDDKDSLPPQSRTKAQGILQNRVPSISDVSKLRKSSSRVWDERQE